jgi:hypothetical protein
MLLGSIFLLIEGSGRWSLDAWLSSLRTGRSAQALDPVDPSVRHSLERGV